MRISLSDGAMAYVNVDHGTYARREPTPDETRQVIAALQATLPEQEQTEPTDGCCTACSGTGYGWDGPCWDCRGSGHAHPDDLMCVPAGTTRQVQP